MHKVDLALDQSSGRAVSIATFGSLSRSKEKAETNSVKLVRLGMVVQSLFKMTGAACCRDNGFLHRWSDNRPMVAKATFMPQHFGDHCVAH